MSSKLVILFALIAIVCCVKANLDRYGKFEQNKSGFDKLCVTKFAISEGIRRYNKRIVANQLSAERGEVQGLLNSREFRKFGSDCSEKAFFMLNRPQVVKFDAGEQKLNESQCTRWIKFESLWRVVNGKRSRDFRVIGIERWLYETRQLAKRSINGGYLTCKFPEGAIDASYLEEANSILAYTDDQLAEAKLKVAAEIEQSDKERKAYQDKFTRKAYSLVNSIIEKTLPKYAGVVAKHKAAKGKARMEKEKAEKIEKMRAPASDRLWDPRSVTNLLALLPK